MLQDFRSRSWCPCYKEPGRVLRVQGRDGQPAKNYAPYRIYSPGELPPLTRWGTHCSRLEINVNGFGFLYTPEANDLDILEAGHFLSVYLCADYLYSVKCSYSVCIFLRGLTLPDGIIIDLICDFDPRWSHQRHGVLQAHLFFLLLYRVQLRKKPGTLPGNLVTQAFPGTETLSCSIKIEEKHKTVLSPGQARALTHDRWIRTQRMKRLDNGHKEKIEKFP